MNSYFKPIFISVFVLFAINSSPVTAFQTTSISSQSDTLRVGVVLSGGGAKGVAHIGILKAIEEAGLKIDFITGTSMGSLVGGLYSIGYSPDQLIQLAKENNFVELFSESANRRYISNYEKGFDERSIVSFPISERGIALPAGIITGQNIYSYLSRLAWSAHSTDDFNNFPIPFATVATDLETGEAKLFRSGYLPDAIRASISIPSAMIPHRIDGRYYIDGGLSRNLPVQDAINMGANYIIAVDVSTPLASQDSLRSLTEIMNQAVMYRINERTEIEKKKADYVITFPELNRYTMADFDLMELFLEIGLAEGKNHVSHFNQLAERQNRESAPRPGMDQATPLPIQNVIINGNTLFDDEFIKRRLEFQSGMSLTPELIEEKISKLYSSQYITQVMYRIVPDEDYYYNLIINIQESKTNDFKVGLRYETQTQASILLESSFQDLLHPGSINRFEVRLGDEIQFNADYIYYGALGSSLAALTSLQYHTEKVAWFQNNQRISSFTNHILRGELSAGNYFNTQNLFSIGIRKDFNSHRNVLNQQGIEASDRDYHAIFAQYKFDRINRKSYPTSGHKFVAKGVHSNPVFLSPLLFTTINGYWKGVYEVTDFLSLKNTLYAGYVYGAEIPWHHWNTPNKFVQPYGYLRFPGFDRYEISERNIQMGSFGVQLEPFYHRFIGVDIYAGRFLEEWNLDFFNNDIEYGVSLTIGAMTILGPLQAIFSSNTTNSFKAELQIGYQF
jgi:NTE family protein